MAANGYATWVGRDRIDRAWRMFTSRADHHIVRILPRTGVYIVRSQRFGARGLTYRVNLAQHTCTCVDYRSHGGAVTCKHLRLVDLLQRRGRALRPRRTLLGNAMCATLAPHGVSYLGTAGAMAKAWFVRALTPKHAFVVNGHTGAPACGHAHAEDVIRTWHTDGSASLYDAPCPACAMNARIGAGDIVMDETADTVMAKAITAGAPDQVFTEAELLALLVRDSESWKAAKGLGEDVVRARLVKYLSGKLIKVLGAAGAAMIRYKKGPERIDAVIAQVFGGGMLLNPRKRPGSDPAAGGAGAGGGAGDPSVPKRPRAPAGPKASTGGAGDDVSASGVAAKEISTAPTSRFGKLANVDDPRMNFVVYGRDRCRQPLISDIGVATLASYQRVATWAALSKITKVAQSMLLYHPTGAGKTVTLWSVLGTFWKQSAPRFQKSFLFVTNAKLASSRQPNQDAWAFYNAAGKGSYSEIRRVAGGATTAATQKWKKYFPAPSTKGGDRVDEGASNTRVISYQQLYNALLANNEHGRMMYGAVLGNLPANKKMPTSLGEYTTMTTSTKNDELNHASFPAYITDIRYTANKEPVVSSIDPLRDAVVVIDEADMLFNEVGEIGSERAALIEHAIFRSYALSGTRAVRVILGTATPAHTSLKVSFRLLNLLVRHADKNLRVGDVGSAGPMRSAGAAAYTNPAMTVAKLRGSGGVPFDTPFMYQYMNAVSDGMSVVELDADNDRFPVRDRHTVPVKPSDAHAASYDAFAEKRFGLRVSKKDVNADDLEDLKENLAFAAAAARAAGDKSGDTVAAEGAAKKALAIELGFIARSNGLRRRANMMPRVGEADTAVYPAAFTPGHQDWRAATFADHIHPAATAVAAAAAAAAVAAAAVDPTAPAAPADAHGRAPKVIALLERIRAIDQAVIDAANGGDYILPKHAIVCDTPGGFGAPLVAAGLIAAGYGWRRFKRQSDVRGDAAIVFADYDVRGGKWAPAAVADETTRLHAAPYGAREADTSFAVLDATLLDSTLDLAYQPTVLKPNKRRAYSSYMVNTKTSIMLLVRTELESREPLMDADEMARTLEAAGDELSYVTRKPIYQSAATWSRRAANLYTQHEIGETAQTRRDNLQAAIKELQTAETAVGKAANATAEAKAAAAVAEAEAEAGAAADAADAAAAAAVKAAKTVVKRTANVETARRAVRAGTPLSGLLETVLSVLAPDASGGRGGAAAAAAAAAAVPSLNELVRLGIVRWAPALSAVHQSAVRRKLTRHFNDRQSNGNGEFARIVIVGPDMATGTSLFEVEHEHLFDALEKVEDGTAGRLSTRHRIQYEGRGWRLCGHRLVRARDALAAPTTLHVYEYRMLGGKIDADAALEFVRAPTRRPIAEATEYDRLQREADAAAAAALAARDYAKDNNLTDANAKAQAVADSRMFDAVENRTRAAFEAAKTMLDATKAKSTLFGDASGRFYIDELVQVLRRDPIEQVYLSEIDQWMKRAAFDRARNKVTVHTGADDLVYTGYVLKNGTAVYRRGGGSRMLVNVAGDELELKLDDNGGDAADSFAAASSSAAAAAAAAAAGGARGVENGTLMVLHDLWDAGALLWDTKAGNWVGVADYEQVVIEREVVHELGAQLDSLIELGDEKAGGARRVAVLSTEGDVALTDSFYPSSDAGAGAGAGASASTAAAAAAAAAAASDLFGDDEVDDDGGGGGDVDLPYRKTWRERASDEMAARRGDTDVGAWIDTASAATLAASEQSGVFLNVIDARDLWLASFAGKVHTKRVKMKDVDVKPSNIFRELADTWRINRANDVYNFDAAEYVKAALGDDAARNAAAGKPENVLARTLVLSSRLAERTLRAELEEYHTRWGFDRLVVMDTLSKRPLLLGETTTEYNNVIFGELAVRRKTKSWRELTTAVAHVYGDEVVDGRTTSMVLPDQLRIALARVLVADRMDYAEELVEYKARRKAHSNTLLLDDDVKGEDDEPVRATMLQAFVHFVGHAEDYIQRRGRRAPTKLYGTARTIVNSMNTTRLLETDMPMDVSFKAFASYMLDIIHKRFDTDDAVLDATLARVLDGILPKPSTFALPLLDGDITTAIGWTPLHRLHANLRGNDELRGIGGTATNAEVASSLRKTFGNWPRTAQLVATKVASTEFVTGLGVFRVPSGTDASIAIVNADLLMPREKLGTPGTEPLMYREVAGAPTTTQLKLTDRTNSQSWPAIVGKWIGEGSVVFTTYLAVARAHSGENVETMMVDAVRTVLAKKATGVSDVSRDVAKRIARAIQDELVHAAGGAGGDYGFGVRHIELELDARVSVYFPHGANAAAAGGAAAGKAEEVDVPRTWVSLTPAEANIFVRAATKMDAAWDNNVAFARKVEDAVVGAHTSSIMQYIGEPGGKDRDVADEDLATTRDVATLMLDKNMSEAWSPDGRPHVHVLRAIAKDGFEQLMQDEIDKHAELRGAPIAKLRSVTLLMWFIDTPGVKLPARVFGVPARVFEDSVRDINAYAVRLASSKQAATVAAEANTVEKLFGGRRETAILADAKTLLSTRPTSADDATIARFQHVAAQLADLIYKASDVQNPALATEHLADINDVIGVLFDIQAVNHGPGDIDRQLTEKFHWMIDEGDDSASAGAGAGDDDE